MLEYLKNFLVGAAVVGAATIAVIGGTVGPFAFFYWLSNGAIWGLLATITTIMAIIGGVAFAALEAKP